MKKGSAEKRVRRLAMIVAAVSLAVFVLGLMISSGMSSMYSNRYARAQNERDQEFRNIISQLEYNGLDDSAWEMMQSFCDAYTDYSNFVIINSNFEILGKLNEGFVGTSSKFFGLAIEDTDYGNRGAICNEKGEILSRHDLKTSSMEALRKLTLAYIGKYGEVTHAASDSSDGSGVTYQSGSGIVGYDVGYETPPIFDTNSGSISVSSSSMNFSSIASKDMYVYFLNDVSSPKWAVNYYNFYTRNQRSLTNAFSAAAIIAFMVYWLSLALFVFLDARRRDNHPALWGVLTLFTNIVGLIVYLSVRPEKKVCENCREVLENSFSYCPVCGTRNRGKCKSCSQLVQDTWSHCPYCGVELNETSVETDATENV